MAVIWTKSWAGSDDGSIIGGLDLKNIQDDLSNVLQAAESISVTAVTITSGILTFAETTTPIATPDSGKIYTQADNKLYFQDGAGVEHEVIANSSIVTLTETTTPTAVPDSGKVYTKADNKLYFQDGAGVEHEIAVV